MKGRGRQPRKDVVKDPFPTVAARLASLRDNLPEPAAKAYLALQLALQPHSRPHGSRPHFEKDFHESLSALFPDACDIRAKQQGAWNQWEVNIDSGPSMFCSVRLEVLSENPGFVRELKANARAVKEILYENDGHWKRQLQPGMGALNFDKLSEFEMECSERARGNSAGGQQLWNGGGGFAQQGMQGWAEPQITCPICRRSMEEDLLSGVHMCVVFATFQCSECRFSWTSFHGRLRPDGETLMGQLCSRCNGSSIAKDWRCIPNQDRLDMGDWRGSVPTHRGMHQSELCEACRDYGNCMGVFYDPFVLTTALSLVSGQYVQWRSFSEEMPELLIADLGPQLREVQICLQPHVSCSQPEGPRPYSSSKGSSSSGGRHDRGEEPRPPLRGSRNLDDEDYDRDRYAPAAAATDARGVKDQRLFDEFLNRVGDQLSQPGRGGGAAVAKPEHKQRYKVHGGGGAPAAGGAAAAPSAGAAGSAGDGAARDRGEECEAGEKAAKGKKFNKIGLSRQEGCQGTQKPATPAPSTPFLDALPPLRRAQLLQVALRQVKATGGAEADKFMLAEKHLSSCSGDYDKAYLHVKALTENTAAS